MEYFDPVRKMAICATPEEQVRQEVVAWLLDSVHVPSHLIEVEFGLGCIQKGNQDRVDILVHHFRAGASVKNPWLLVECKRHNECSLADLEIQVNKYLRVLRPQYIMLGLGAGGRFLGQNADGRHYSPIATLPQYPEIQVK